MSNLIDINQITEYLTVKHACLLLSIIIVVSILFGKKRPKNAPPMAHVGLPVVGKQIYKLFNLLILLIFILKS